MLARVQGIEVGDAVDAEHHSLTVDHELPVPVLQRRFDDPRIAVAPVVPAAGDQADAVAITLQAQPVAVVFDLVKPVRAGGDAGRPGGDAELEHAPEIGIRGGFWNWPRASFAADAQDRGRSKRATH